MTDAEKRISEALAALDGPQTAETSMAVNAEYAQACNPAAIRELLDRLQKAEAENERLREALERLARLGNGRLYGNSEGNMIARAALEQYGSQSDETHDDGA